MTDRFAIEGDVYISCRTRPMLGFNDPIEELEFYLEADLPFESLQAWYDSLEIDKQLTIKAYVVQKTDATQAMVRRLYELVGETIFDRFMRGIRGKD